MAAFKQPVQHYAGNFRTVKPPAVTRWQATAQGSQAELHKPIKIVGCGSCGVDYLASVAAFPQPDQKLRTDALEVQGGGNCANALTAAARLGLEPTIVSKIGDDGLGDGIISELHADGIDTSLLLREANSPSPFTYIIVDRADGTRTCIHTPGAALKPEELHSDLIRAALQDAALVYFDGRLTEAAILLARAARAAGVPVLVEGERLRPGLQDLLAEADYIVTSAHFPQEWTGEANIGDALVTLASRLPQAQMIFTTQGAKGSICLIRAADQDQPGQPTVLQELLNQLFSQLQQEQHTSSSNSASPVCSSSSGVSILPAAVAASTGAVQLQRSSQRVGTAVAEAAKAAAQAAAALNADAGNAQKYNATEVASAGDKDSLRVSAHVLVATAAGLPPGAVADTTGAGDAFIGSVMYGITTGMTPEQILRLGAVVAACKCTMLGARPGLPRRDQLAAQLLGVDI